VLAFYGPAVLALIPRTRSDFFGPMAVAMMGGLVIATLLTLIYLSIGYAWVFAVEIPRRQQVPK